MRLRFACWGLMLIAAMAAGQSPEAKKLAFEVATVKPVSAEAALQRIMNGGVPFLSVQGNRAHVGPLSLTNLIVQAYKIEPYQLVGPDWMGKNDVVSSFEIDATLPEGSTLDQARLMLQTLLEERFGLNIHKGSAMLDAYALVVGKDGAKPRAKDAPKHDVKGMVTLRGVKLWFGQPTHVEGSSVDDLMSYFAIRAEGVPVVNKTGIQGSFDFQFDELPQDVNDFTPAAVARLGREEIAAREMERLSGSVKPLGLKLERQKSAMETIVVDHIEKAPTAN